MRPRTLIVHDRADGNGDGKNIVTTKIKSHRGQSQVRFSVLWGEWIRLPITHLDNGHPKDPLEELERRLNGAARHMRLGGAFGLREER